MTFIKSYYDNKAIRYKIKGRRLKNVLELTGEVRNKLVLDVGCANGLMGEELQKRRAKVTGIDVSPKAIKQAKAVLSYAKVVDLNNEKLPFKKQYFDIVIASEIIEHLFEPLNSLREFYRVLKKEGELIITTPNFLYWGHRLKLLIGNFRYAKSGPFDESHIHFYTYKTILEDLQKTKFQIVQQNHVYAGSNLLSVVKNKWPSLFAYQFVILSQKK